MKERYHRQILLPEIGEEGQQKISHASALIVGAGGLGCPISLYLAGAGIGRLGIIDDDVVSPSNLHRQILYTEDEVGQSKVHCAARRLRQLNSALCIDAYPLRLTTDNATGIISRYDLVVDGCDNHATRYLISDVCHRLGKPYVYAAIGSLSGQVALLCHHPDAPTYRDIYPEEPATSHQAEQGVIGTTPAIIGSIAANEALKYITGIPSPLLSHLLTFDLLTMQSHIISLQS